MDTYVVNEATGSVSICVDSGVTEGFQAELIVALSAMDGKAGKYTVVYMCTYFMCKGIYYSISFLLQCCDHLLHYQGIMLLLHVCSMEYSIVLHFLLESNSNVYCLAHGTHSF